MGVVFYVNLQRIQNHSFVIVGYRKKPKPTKGFSVVFGVNKRYLSIEGNKKWNETPKRYPDTELTPLNFQRFIVKL